MQLGASLDRGQSYNPTSSDAYAQRMEIMDDVLRKLIATSPPLPTSLAELDGEWELIFTSVAHGIFRSSPFFLAIQVRKTERYVPCGAKPQHTWPHGSYPSLCDMPLPLTAITASCAAVQEAYTRAGFPDKAELFFKLHELQTCSWGARFHCVGAWYTLVKHTRSVLVCPIWHAS